MAIQTFNRPILMKNNVEPMEYRDSDQSLADQYATLCHLRETVCKAEAEALERAKSQSRTQ
jgi:hypothetical protein